MINRLVPVPEVRVVVIGMGNPLLTDDTIGLHVVQSARQLLGLKYPDVSFVTVFSGGFDLLDELIGYDYALLVDSVDQPLVAPGTIMELDQLTVESAFLAQPRINDSHGLQIHTVLALGRMCGYRTPREVAFLGITGTEYERFSEVPSALVGSALNGAVDAISNRLQQWTSLASERDDGITVHAEESIRP